MTKPPRRLRDLTGPVLQAVDRAGVALSISVETQDGPDRLYVGEAAAQILGYTAEELANTSPLDHVIPEDRPRLAELRRQFLADGGTPRPHTLRFARKNGGIIPCEVVLHGGLVDGQPLAIDVLRDLRSELAMSEALRESEANFRMLAEAAPDAIAVTRHGRILYMNPAGARMLDHDDPAEIIGKHLGAFLDPEDAAAMNERLGRVAAGERIPPREYTVRSSNGTYSTIEIASMAIDFHGQPANLAVGREVSARKQLQAELMQADRMATVGTLAAGVAHEINNPLTYVLLHLERLWRKLPSLVTDDERRGEIQTMVGAAIEGAERMTSIVRDLLAFSRPDDRDQRRIDVHQVLGSTVKLASTGLKHRAKIVTVFDECPPITGNPSKLGQVFLNLLVNALQAVEDIGREGEVKVRLRNQDDEWLVIELTDNGPGIEPTTLPRIFDPFFTTKPVGTGTGLGLPISRSITESMGGTISIENHAPTGVRVMLRLPVSEEPAAEPPPPTPDRHRAKVSSPLRRVLIIDDDPGVARALAALLGDSYATELFTDSSAALTAILGEDTYDAVFCDVSMPAPSGIDIYNSVAQQRPDYVRRFAFITGGATTNRTARMLRELNRPILAKPFAIDEVLALAAKLVAAT